MIRMNVAGLTQWESSWPGERVCGRGWIRKNCGNLWKAWDAGRVPGDQSVLQAGNLEGVSFACEPGEVLRSDVWIEARDAASDDMSDCFDFKQNPLPPIELGIWNRGNGSAAAGGNHCSSAGQIVRLATLASHGSPDNSPRLSMAAKAGPAHGVQPKAKASPSKKERSLPCRISR